MAAKKTEDEYKDLYFETKFTNIEEKLDILLEVAETKASATFVNSLAGRMTIIENNHVSCPLHTIVIDIKQLKDDRDVLMDATEDIRFYKKKPSQFKLLVIGIILLAIMNLAIMVPTILTWLRSAKYDIVPLIEQPK